MHSQANRPPSLPPTDIPIAVEPNDLIGSGVVIQDSGNAEVEAGLGRLEVQLQNGLGEPVEDQYFALYTQKQDINGNWVVDESLKSRTTDNSGNAIFEAPMGNYIVTSDFRGYNWGNANDVEGQANVPIQSGHLTRMSVALGLLNVGFFRGDGSIIEDQYVQVYTQKQDLAGNWVIDES